MPHAEHPTVERPPFAIHAMTTFELREYRKQLEQAIAFFGNQDPVSPARDQLQGKLADVLAEEAERRAIARANGAS